MTQALKETLFYVAAIATVIVMMQTADANEATATACMVNKTGAGSPVISLEDAIHASGLSLAGSNSITPLRNVNGMVLLANAENDTVGQVIACPDNTAILKLFGSEPRVIRAGLNK